MHIKYLSPRHQILRTSTDPTLSSSYTSKISGPPNSTHTYPTPASLYISNISAFFHDLVDLALELPEQVLCTQATVAHIHDIAAPISRRY
ncbi:hypothetical protein K443DRAFT_9926 [Laccaria amethystina LaAM-08-1]|uniref:Uncharacterized protein n=1 Tax=Laccaria amethystina LaAM-08-1 TaxID=1095629 RepID=A0A0C9XIG6_9AGAR|nr:hypothetical protein K443DRAFT_9926 [Laccaria amethystina LaAM-08-1]